MTDVRLGSKGNIRFRWYEPGGFANPYWPTVAELNAGQELEGVTLWESFEVGAQASDTSDTASIKAKSAVARRAAGNYGGSASFWYPGDHTNMTNLASLVYSIFRKVNRAGYVVVSVDGEIGETGQPAANFSFAAGDLVSVFGVMTDEWDDSITGEEAFYYSRTFLKNGMMRAYTVASTALPIATVTATGATGAVAGLGALEVKVNGRDWTRGVRYTSSDPSKVIATDSGVFKRVAAGTSTITATLPRTSPAVTVTQIVTVS